MSEPLEFLIVLSQHARRKEVLEEMRAAVRPTPKEIYLLVQSLVLIKVEDNKITASTRDAKEMLAYMTRVLSASFLAYLHKTINFLTQSNEPTFSHALIYDLRYVHVLHQKKKHPRVNTLI